ncbi:Mesoderm-specific transcript protein [Halotydeus destructor]|nr:Mesoderm-specific transcript protein [Halotydeus destructor]
MGFKTHLLSLLVVVFSISFTVFINYPPPPWSPLVWQWHQGGKNHSYDGYKIFYRDYVRNENEFPRSNLLILHGFPTSSLDWYKVWPDLGRKFGRVIAPDFLGMGFSDKPRYFQYSIKWQADMVQNLLKELNVTSVHILAHDYGDTVAQELMARFNEGESKFIIETVCFLNGGIFPSKHNPVLMQRLLRMPIIGTVLAKWSNFYFFQVSLNSVFGAKGPFYEEMRDFWFLVRYNEGHRVTGELLSYIDQRFLHEERWVGAIRDFKPPLHFIYGPSDPVNPPPFQEYFKDTIRHGSIDVLNKNIGHYPQLEDPENVVKSYFAFLAKKAAY